MQSFQNRSIRRWKRLRVRSMAIMCLIAMIAMGSTWHSLQGRFEDSFHDELTLILDEQVNCWNQGDIPGFMQTYWKSESLTFASGGEVERGWQATFERYQKRYPDRAAMGKLRFSELETQRLSDSAALMLGRWHLDREQPIGGNFTLVWKKIEGEWKIIHDHTSKTP